MGFRQPSTTQLSAEYLDDIVVMSANEAWTYVQIPLASYEFQSYSQRVVMADSFANALAGVLLDTNTPVECHLRIVYRPFDTPRWGEKTHRAAVAPTSGWGDYAREMTQHVANEEYQTKQLFLGIRLGSRQEQQGLFSALNPLAGLAKRLHTPLNLDDKSVGEKELAYWHNQAHELRRVLGESSFQAVPATADDLAWIVARPLWPSMSQPQATATQRRTWGAGELTGIVDAEVHVHRRSVEAFQLTDRGDVASGHTATLSVSRFPDVLHFPEQEPWIHLAGQLPFPVDFSLRFTVVPFQTVKKDVGRKLADAKDQAQHIAESGTGVPLQVREQLDVATTLEYQLDKTRAPWMYATHRLQAFAPTAELLAARVRTVIDTYRELGMDVVWSSGDQFDLLLESMPADKVRTKSYRQRQELFVLSGGMPHATAQVGDQRALLPPASCYLGYTTSRVLEPVFFAPHSAMANNYPPGVAITGAPGGGKSYLAFTLAHQMAAQGIWTIYLDPKADAKPMADIDGLDGARVFDLRDGNAGMLDPFSLGATPAEATLLAMETLRLLLGGSLSEEREEALLHALDAVIHQPEPSLTKVVTYLMDSPQTASRNLGTVLRTISDLPFASLCFSPVTTQRLRPEDGLTIVTLLGLDLPNASTTPDDYSYENRLAVSVMYLLTRYARQLMLNLDKSHPKAICIDEAWAITSTPQGAKLIPEIARMGRSHNTSLVLVSQNAGDLMAESVTNSLSTKFAFRSSIPGEIDDVLSLFALADDQGYEAAVRDLRNGECLMQDMDGRISRVQVDAWNADLFRTFNTNPETRGKSDQPDT